MNTSEQGKDLRARDQAPARHVAHRLIHSRRSGRPGGDDDARAAATACNNLYRELSRWVGTDGCHALFTRALAQAQPEHPALSQIQLRARSEPYLDGVGETITAHGDAATFKGLESMLVHLVKLLGRLIGDDMAAKLIEQSLAASEHANTTADDRRKEA